MEVSNGGLVVKWSLNASPSELRQHSLLAEFKKRGSEGVKLRVTRQLQLFWDAIVVEGQTGMDVNVCRGGKCVCGCVLGRERARKREWGWDGVSTTNRLSGKELPMALSLLSQGKVGNVSWVFFLEENTGHKASRCHTLSSKINATFWTTNLSFQVLYSRSCLTFLKSFVNEVCQSVIMTVAYCCGQSVNRCSSVGSDWLL